MTQHQSGFGMDDAEHHPPVGNMPWQHPCAECGSTAHWTGQHSYGPTSPEDTHAYVGDGGIICKNCVEHGDERWGKVEHGDKDPISFKELRQKLPHGQNCDNCYKEIVPPRPHTESECEHGEDCENFNPEQHAQKYNDPHGVLEDMIGRGIDIHHKPAEPHMTEKDPRWGKWGDETDKAMIERSNADWEHTLHQRKSDEEHAGRQIDEMFKGSPEVEFMKGNTQGPTFHSKRHTAYGETKAPDQVDTLREENCPVCGENDAYDGDQCQVCGFVTPPEMFRDPDLSKAKMMDLRADPASGAPNDQDGVVHDLPPVDPDQVDENGEVDGAIEGEEAGTDEAMDTDGDGIVDVETRGLGDDNVDPNAEPGQDDDDDEPIDPEDLNADGEVSPEEAQVAQEQEGVDADAEEVKAAEDAEDTGTVSAPVDPDAATGHVNQGGEPFTPGPNAPTPVEPGEPGDQVADDPTEVDTGGQEADGQVDTGTNEVAGEPGDGIPDLMCPSCGFEADAATPTSTPGSPAAPANEGDGMAAGAVCPNCQGATLMSTGEIQEMTGAPK